MPSSIYVCKLTSGRYRIIIDGVSPSTNNGFNNIKKLSAGDTERLETFINVPVLKIYSGGQHGAHLDNFLPLKCGRKNYRRQVRSSVVTRSFSPRRVC